MKHNSFTKRTPTKIALNFYFYQLHVRTMFIVYTCLQYSCLAIVNICSCILILSLPPPPPLPSPFPTTIWTVYWCWVVHIIERPGCNAMHPLPCLAACLLAVPHSSERFTLAFSQNGLLQVQKCPFLYSISAWWNCLVLSSRASYEYTASHAFLCDFLGRPRFWVKREILRIFALQMIIVSWFRFACFHGDEWLVGEQWMTEVKSHIGAANMNM